MGSKKRNQHSPSQRLVIIMPPWLGETVMATPALRALRELYPDAEITAVMRRHLKPVLDDSPWINRFITVHRKKDGKDKGSEKNADKNIGPIRLARQLAKGKFDTAVVLPNGFRSALLVRTAGVKRRVGYDRDGRGGLLTDRLLPRRATGKFIPVSTIDYYLGIPRYLGATDVNPKMTLFTDAARDQQAAEVLTETGWEPKTGKPLVVLSPGASHGRAKLWGAERFAKVADQLIAQHDATVVVNGNARERKIIQRVMTASANPLFDLQAKGTDVGVLKSIIRRASLVVSNDTGPRHIAAAFGVPVVTVFGPTDPAWSEINFEWERQVYANVYCRPCQKKNCPLRNTPEDLQCMTKVDAELVVEQASALLGVKRDSHALMAEGHTSR